MAGKPQYKMSQADRAKQFMPFSALKGLEKALKAQEEQPIRRHHSTTQIRNYSPHHGDHVL